MTTISVTSARPGRWETPLGIFEFRHIKLDLLYGYRMIDVGGGQLALAATPEKALLDLVYLQPGGDSLAYLQELSLQNLERLNPDELLRQAEKAGSPKLRRASKIVAKLAYAQVQEHETLG